MVLGAIVVLVAMFLLVMTFHCFLPRPKTVQSRQHRRSVRRMSRRHAVGAQHPKPLGGAPQSQAHAGNVSYSHGGSNYQPQDFNMYNRRS